MFFVSVAPLSRIPFLFFFFFSIFRPPPRSTLFPYTTLFRSFSPPHVHRASIPVLHLLRIEYSGNCIREARPFGALSAQVFLSRRCELIVFRPLLVFRNLPFRLDPLLFFQAVQRRIKRPSVHLQNL